MLRDVERDTNGFFESFERGNYGCDRVNMLRSDGEAPLCCRDRMKMLLLSSMPLLLLTDQSQERCHDDVAYIKGVSAVFWRKISKINTVNLQPPFFVHHCGSQAFSLPYTPVPDRKLFRSVPILSKIKFKAVSL